MSTANELPTTVSTIPPSITVWQRRFFIVMTILGWLALAIAIIWGIGQIIEPLVLLGFAALLAYLIFPLVRLFERHMPRVMAILVSLLVLLAVMGFVIYFVVVAAIQQFALLIGAVQKVIGHPEKYPQLQNFIALLSGLGISKDQFHVSGEQVVSYLKTAAIGVIPIVSSILITIISLFLIATLAVYIMVDGSRVTNWLRHKTPLKYRGKINMFIDELDHSVGGFVRGQILLAAIMAAVVGVGAFIIGVPYAFLLAVIVFAFEFVPQIGSYISGAIGFVFALTVGWQTALIYAIFVIVVQVVLDGQILAPRILGHSVGLNPIVSIFALLVGTKLFGLLGAFFACPAAGILQTFIVAFWGTWRERHPDQFPEEAQKQQMVEAKGHEALT
jgi:predicted PurR-regulated permease PerM